MIDFSVCIELAFAEDDRSYPDRVRAAAESGFAAVEIWDWQGKPIGELGRALRETGTALHTLCAEGWQDKCQLGDPASHSRFVDRVKAAATIAAELDVPKIVVLAGNLVPGRERAAQLAAAGDALARASDAIATQPVELLVEVVNRAIEGPNALLQDSATTIALLRRLDRPNVRYLYDRYHAILNGEALGEVVGDAMDLVGHIQAADIPGRCELGAGAHDWIAELRWLLEAGYAGYVGIEAIPKGPSPAIHARAAALLRQAEASIASTSA